MFKFSPKQAEFIESDEKNVILVSGVGFGKTYSLAHKAIRIALKNTDWFKYHSGAQYDHLRVVYCAPQAKYLTQNSIPAVRSIIAQIEDLSGQKITADTGRNLDGFFGGGQPRIEMANGVDILFFPLPDESSAVSLNACGGLIDEFTFLKNEKVMNRLQHRVRDKRALFLQFAAVGTPEPGHPTYDIIYNEEGEPKKNYHVIQASSLDNPFINKDFFEINASMSSNINFMRSQLLGEWTGALTGKRFSESFNPDIHVRPCPFSPKRYGDQFYIGWDPGQQSGSVLILANEDGVWWIVDEIVIQGKTTRAVCAELKVKGYSHRNLIGIGVDIDAARNRAIAMSEGETDVKIIRDNFFIQPKYRGNRAKVHSNLRIRLNMIEHMLNNNMLYINSDLMPRSKKTMGIVNALRNFDLKPHNREEGMFLDKPTAEAERLWKHPIDALHYALIHWAEHLYKPIVTQVSKAAKAEKKFKDKNNQRRVAIQAAQDAEVRKIEQRLNNSRVQERMILDILKRDNK